MTDSLRFYKPMTNLLLRLLSCIPEGLIFAALLVFVSKRYGRYRLLCQFLFVVLEVLSVYFLYRGFEAVWVFFVHPYVSLLIVDLADLYFCRKDRFEKLFLWPFFILPALSGFILCFAWMMKIRIFGELISSLLK